MFTVKTCDRHEPIEDLRLLGFRRAGIAPRSARALLVWLPKLGRLLALSPAIRIFDRRRGAAALPIQTGGFAGAEDARQPGSRHKHDRGREAALTEGLTDLHLPTVRRCYEESACLAERKTLSYESYLLELVTRKCEDRRQTSPAEPATFDRRDRAFDNPGRA